MTTTAAPTAPTSAGRVRSGATSPGTARTPEDGVAGRAGVPTAGAATRAERREPGPSGFHAAVVLAVLLTVPAVFLVARGELSPHDAMVRFGCAWAFATGGVALVLSTVGGGSASQDGEPADLAPEQVADPAYPDPAYPAPADAAPADADPARVDDTAVTPAG